MSFPKKPIIITKFTFCIRVPVCVRVCLCVRASV